jgi:DNA polymerase-1
MSKRHVYVDGNALVHAAWHGYPERLGPDGLSYRALHGFLSKLHRMDRDYAWDEMLVVFDPQEGSLYRKGLFADYKAHRPQPDPDLVRQMSLIEKALPELGVATLKVPGVESDDVIGTLAKRSAQQGCLVMVVTPDKDMAQLVDDYIGLLRPLRGPAAIETPFDYVNHDGVVSKFGVAPNQIADWLALIGDVSDNIPGVEGVGEKRATALIEKYGDVRTLMTRAEEIKGKVGEALRDRRPHIENVVKLTTIQIELDHSQWTPRASCWSESARESWAALAGFPHWMGRFNFLADASVPTSTSESESPFDE